MSPPTHTETQPRYYRPELDVLRLIAFLCVFFTHRMELAPIDPARHLWIHNVFYVGVFGVPVFFLLSAFLITELLMRERAQTGSIHLKAFYVRRILRIWPLYFAAFYGLAVLGHVLPGVGGVTVRAWLPFTFFSGNWFICMHGWVLSYAAQPLWSISVEEQFYIAIPIIAAYGGRNGLKIASLVLLAISYLLVMNYARYPWHGFSSEWTNSFIQFQFFSAGTLLALYLRGRLPQ